jgi:hypothetical protein
LRMSALAREESMPEARDVLQRLCFDHLPLDLKG